MIRTRPLAMCDLPRLLEIYQLAFSGYPWHEDLSQETVADRWQYDSSQPNFQCFIGENDDKIIGSVWWNCTNYELLLAEKGPALTAFAQNKAPNLPWIWEREVLVDPCFQGQGLATLLRRNFLAQVQTEYGKALIMTRMRDDNYAIIRIAEKMSFKRTGIRMQSSGNPEVYHEYWYCQTG